MFEWMKEHRVALITSCSMFAVMAVLMAECMMGGDEDLFSLFDDSSVDFVVWIWRAGGTLTWPVFMWLLLSPHDRGAVLEGRRTILNICIASAIYGGGGLWIIWVVLEFLIGLASNGAVLLAPIVSILGIVLPFAYAWGFVALYGYGRAYLLGRGYDRGWMSMSIIAAIVGVYGIGVLIYLALTAVSLPIAFAIAPIAALGSEELALHVAIDMLAIAISTGNFASQWWAFRRVDEYFDEPVSATPVAPVAPAAYATPPAYTDHAQPASEPVVAQPMVQQAQPTLPRLVCTCGAELPIDQSKLPQVVSAARFCPRCGIQLLP